MGFCIQRHRRYQWNDQRTSRQTDVPQKVLRVRILQGQRLAERNEKTENERHMLTDTKATSSSFDSSTASSSMVSRKDVLTKKLTLRYHKKSDIDYCSC